MQSAIDMLALAESVSSEAYRICGIRGDCSRECLREVEHSLNYGRYLEAVRPLVDAKTRLLLYFVPQYRILLKEDGMLDRMETIAPELPPETMAVMAQLDEYINQTALLYGMRPPMPKGVS